MVDTKAVGRGVIMPKPRRIDMQLVENIRLEEVASKDFVQDAVAPYIGVIGKTESRMSSYEEDTRESFDLVVSKDVCVSVRLRKNKYLSWRDFTLRSRTNYSGKIIRGDLIKTEYQKISEGKGSCYFYGWYAKDNKTILSYILVDLNKLRPHLTSHGAEKPNGDGTYFVPYSVKFLKSIGAIIHDSNDRKDPGIDIIHGDCMDYMKDLPSDAFDLAIVDPPYGININNSGRLGHYGGKGKSWDDATPDKAYFMELMRVSKDQIIWGGNYFLLPPTRCFLIWDKQQPEAVSFASCEYAWTSFDQSAKTYYQRPQNADPERIHPTQKPVKLYEWLLKNYAKDGDSILDTHLGSGSSAIAANNMGYSLTGIEIDEDYCREAKRRFNDATKQSDLFG